MTGGQSADLAAEGKTLTVDELEHMYALKTGALIHAAIFSARILYKDLDDARTAALDNFGRKIGIAFQIKDDILDVEGETHVIGKPSGSDAERGKATYPALFGVDASRERCDELLSSALSDLASFGSAAAPLEWLARYIVERGQ
jgi:farnesyl diphosphate synthase